MGSRSTKNDGFGLIVYAVVVVGAALLIALSAVLSIAIYVLPVLAVCLFIGLEWPTGNPPVIPDASAFQFPDKARRIGELLGERNAWIEYRDDQERLGDELGIRRRQDGRFSERSHSGKDFNHRFDVADAKLDAIQGQVASILEAARDVLRSHGWQPDFESWVRKRALHLSLRNALYAFPAFLLAAWLVCLFFSGLSSAVDQILVFNPLPHGSSAVLVLANILASTLFAISLVNFRRELFLSLDQERAAKWNSLWDKWGCYYGEIDSYFIAVKHKLESQPGEDARQQQSKRGSFEDWHSVLGVSPDSVISEIKRAFHSAIKGCHPDKAAGAGLDDEIRAFMSEKTKRINTAYEAAKQAKGFA